MVLNQSLKSANVVYHKVHNIENNRNAFLFHNVWKPNMTAKHSIRRYHRFQEHCQ